MKVAFGYKIQQKAWGGGNQFAISLKKYLEKRGVKVVFNLKDKDIDLILFTDPRSYRDSINFDSFQILKYLILKNNKAIVVHRINECDERKNTKYLNKLLKIANYCADYTVLIATWLKDIDIYIKNRPLKIIMNGADNLHFSNLNNSHWDFQEPLKIVTHHWSSNKMKGFDVYQKLDELLNTENFKNLIKFAYIGNLPYGFRFKNSTHIKPLNGEKLASELSKHHVYITASINEPAGMHHIEGALAGLPIIYRNSGALPEYCGNYGIGFNDENFLPALKKMIKDYSFYKNKIQNYPYTSEKMNKEYLELFEDLVSKREIIYKNRNFLRSPIYFLANSIFIFFFLKKINDQLKVIIKNNLSKIFSIFRNH